MAPADSDSDKAAALYRRFGPLIYARCRRILKDATLAEDATQEVFMRVWRHIADAPDERAALSWMYRISTNYCLNLLRDAGKRPLTDDGEVPETPVDSFERVFEDRDLALRVLMHAPEKLRAPALLHYVDGLDQGRVATALNVTRRTVINRLGAFTEWARTHLRAGESA